MSLNLIAEQCELYGDLTVDKGKCFIATNTLWIGTDGLESTISLTAEHHIHAIYCKLRGDTQLTIGLDASGSIKSRAETSRLIIDDTLDIDRRALLDLQHTEFSSYRVYSFGEFTLDTCVVDIKKLIQHGKLQVQQSALTITDKFDQSTKSQSTIESSQLLGGVFAINGNFTLQKSTFEGKEFSIYSGNCAVIDCQKFYVQDEIWVHSSVTARFARTKLEALRSININAAVIIESSSVATALLRADLSRLTIIGSSITVHQDLAINNGLIIKNSELKCKNVRFSGELEISDLLLQGDRVVFDCEKASVIDCMADVKKLTVKGSDIPRQVIFKNCSLVVETLNQSQHVTLDTSSLYGIVAGLSHFVAREFELIASRFVTDSQVHVTGGSRLLVHKFSTLMTERLWEHGDVDVKDSKIIVKRMLHQGGKLTTAKSSVEIQEAILSGGVSIFEAGSSIVAGKMRQISGRMKLTGKSHFVVVDKLVTHESATISSSQSIIKVPSLVAIGSLELQTSLLSTDELAIYAKFKVTQSQVLAEKFIEFTRTADAIIQKSSVVSKKIITAGVMRAQDSIFQIAEDFTALDDSKTTLVGKTVLQSGGDALIRGHMETQLITDKDQKHSPALIIKKHLKISRDASITGDALMLEVDKVTHLGDMSFTGSLVARGGLFSTSGTIRASEIFLGFDRAVVNTGSLSAKNITIHSNYFNILGWVSAEQSFTSVGLLNFNMGLLVANSVMQDSLLSLNTSFVLPNLCSDFEYIFSTKNLMSCARNIATIFLPVKSAVDLAFTVPGFISSASRILGMDWSKLLSMRPHELMPMLCKLKSIALSGYGVWNSGAKTLTEISDPKSYKFEGFSSTPLGSLGHGTLGLVAGSCTDNSLLHANFGRVWHVNTSFSDFLHANFGHEIGLFSHAVSTSRLANFGFSGGIRASYTATKVLNRATMSGIESFSVKADEFDNGEDGVIAGRGARVAIKHVSQKGKITLIGGQLNFGDFFEFIDATTTLKDMHVKGDRLESAGGISLDRVSGELKDVYFKTGSTEQIKDSAIRSDRLVDDGQMAAIGQVLLETKKYVHHGHISLQVVASQTDVPPKNSLHISAQRAELYGSCDLESATFAIEAFSDASEFLAAKDRYSQYHFSSALAVATKDKIDVAETSRHCDIYAEGSSVYWGSQFTGPHKLSLVSTVGGIKVASDVQASSFYAKSAADFYMDQLLGSSDTTYIDAAGKFYNLGGALAGDKVIVKAAGIYVVTPGSSLGRQTWALPIGKTGVIHGREVYLSSTVGNIENHGGIIRGTEYAQLISEGEVLNLCNQRTVKDTHDTYTVYDPATISGGTGTSTDGTGLYVKARGKVISDASRFASDGVNYIEGEKGVELTARTSTYVSCEKHKKKYLGSKTEHKITTATNIYSSSVYSGQGRNVILSGGEVLSVATQFVSPGGTDIYADKDVKLFSLKTQNRIYESTSYLWGLLESEKDKYRQQSTPTLFYDRGMTRIHSATGTVDARGALFIGDGDLEIKAAKRIIFGVDILDHSDYSMTRSLGVSFFGMPAWQAYSSGGGVWGALAAIDPMLAKLDALLNSSNLTDGVANTLNLGISTFNTANSLMRGLARGSVTSELLSRYGLGGDQGFSPTVSISLTQTTTKSHFQTQGVGGVDRAKVTIQAGEGVDLINGVTVHAKESMDIDSPEIIATAAALHSSTSTHTTSVSVGVTASGSITDVSASFSQRKDSSVSHINAQLSSAGGIKLHHGDGAMDRVILTGAKITADRLDADIGLLVIADQRDETKTKSISASASSGGSLSAYYGGGSSKHVAQTSGIHVTQGLDTGDHTFHVGELQMTGGTITTDGDNHARIDKLVAHELHDQSSYTGVGVSVNVHDLQRLTDPHMAAETTGSQAIATESVTIDCDRYDAIRRPVIFSRGARDLEIKEQIGAVHTTSVDGVEVIRDISIHATIDVPITTREDLAQAAANIRQGAAIVGETIERTVGSVREALFGDEKSQPIRPEVPTENIDIINYLEQHPDSPDAQERMQIAIMRLCKIGGRKSLEKLLDLVSEGHKESIVKLLADKSTRDLGIIKAYVKGKSLIFTVVMNMGIECVKHPDADSKAMVREGIKNTVKELIFRGVLKQLLKRAAGPVGTTITFFRIAESLLYDKAIVEAARTTAEECRRKAKEWQDKVEQSGKRMSFRDIMFVSNMYETAAKLDAGAAQQAGLHTVLSYFP